jgi:prophage antirepressor-like protein
VDEEDKNILNMINVNHILGKNNYSYRERQTVFVSEAGLYSLILASQASFAKEFRKLVCKIILPSIRKFGSYQAELQLAQAMEQLVLKDNQLQQDHEACVRAEQRATEAEEHAAIVLEAKKKAELKAKRVNKFMHRVSMREKKLEWIYIATTKEYAKERIFKIGSTERLSSRISGYATGHPKSRAYFYGWVKQCYASKDLDYHIQKILSAFKHKEEKDDKGRGELYHGIKFTDLVDIVAFIVDNYDKSIEYVNTFIKSRLDQSMEEEDEEVAPLKIGVNVTYQVGNVEHTEIITEHSEGSKIREELENIIDSIEAQAERIGNEIIVIKRSELVCRLAQVVSMDKKDLWSAIKGITKWKNGRTEIDEFGTTIKIEY